MIISLLTGKAKFQYTFDQRSLYPVQCWTVQMSTQKVDIATKNKEGRHSCRPQSPCYGADCSRATGVSPLLGLFASTSVQGTVASLLIALFVVVPPAPADEPIRFPEGSGVLDVTKAPFHAVADDEKDDTVAIQAALDAYPSGNRIVYLPPGKYIISDTLKWGGTSSGNAQKRTILQGSGEKLSTVYLPDASAGFSGESSSKALIWTGSKPAQRFRNAIRDLTIEIGAGNPGAIGLQFNASNQGCVRNVTIRAARDSGSIGLDLGHTDEIGPLLVRHLTVEGFGTGISTKWPVNSNTFEHITLRGQRRFGWHNYHQMIFVRGLRSENSVPAIYNEKNSWGTVSLIDSKIHGVGAGENTPGIWNQRQMYLRNVEITGYNKPVDNADKGRDKGDITKPGLVSEDTSHKNVDALFREIPDHTIATAGEVEHLSVKETRRIEWGDPEKWANLIDFGADPSGEKDSSAALQRAIDSGAKTVFLPAGANFKMTGEVEIRGAVERIIGLEGRFTAENKGVWRLVDSGADDAPAVIIERINGRSGAPGIRLIHESKRTLIVSSAMGINIEGRGSGDIFVEDLSGSLNLYQPGQSAWCRQLNTEVNKTMLHNNGGKLWLLDIKTEKIGTIIETVNGGITDAAGIFIYSNIGWKDGVPAFIIDESTAVLAGINERNFNRRPVSLWFRETQAGETRERTERSWVYLSGK